eukprot:3941476-Rhodomonas_salina.1
MASNNLAIGKDAHCYPLFPVHSTHRPGKLLNLRMCARAGAMALCKAGADVNARTSRGETPLSVAMSSAARDVIAVLKQFGATR